MRGRHFFVTGICAAALLVAPVISGCGGGGDSNTTTSATTTSSTATGAATAPGAAPTGPAAAGGPAATGAPSTSGPAKAGPAPRSFYGAISAEPLPGGRELARIGGGGVGTLRINLAWGSVQSGSRAPYDWTHYDGVVGGAARNGIRILATVYSSPVWAERSPEYPPLGSRLSQFEDFARAAVRRYGHGGTFWRTHPDIPEIPIEDWQLWNEPNSPLFWKPAPSISGYLQLLRGFDSAVRGADPHARIVLGGLFPDPEGGITMQAFMSALYRGGAGGLFDAAAIHPYAANPTIALRRTEQLRRLMDRAGDHAAGVWISEVGWASGGDPSGLTVGPERQADYLRQTFRLEAEDRVGLGLRGVIWYSLNDTPGSGWPAHCGLFNLDGTAKPSWGAFTDLTGGVR